MVTTTRASTATGTRWAMRVIPGHTALGEVRFARYARLVAVEIFYCPV